VSADAAAKYAAEMLRLTAKARHVVRDLDPKVRGAVGRGGRGVLGGRWCE
jgi:hypothetical protein